METSFKLQMDVKNNAEDLRRYMLDLDNWVNEMKQKDEELKKEKPSATDYPPPRNKVNKSKTEQQARKSGNEKKAKIRAYDYAAWDKYDADKACEECEEEEEETSDEKKTAPRGKTQEQEESAPLQIQEEAKREREDEKLKKEKSAKNADEAFYEKELGNAFVKKQKWEDAIKCYTRAIELDSNNAIYYSNRAICFIKLQNFRSAEVDATVAIQLDKTYVKAYQRRALARSALGQLQEALSDYKEILKMEPNNAVAKAEMSKLERRIDSNGAKSRAKPVFNPKSIFTSKATRVKDKEDSPKCRGDAVAENALGERIAEKKPRVKVDEVPEVKVEAEAKKKMMESIFGDVPEGYRLSKCVRIPPHLRSKKKPRRISIKEVVSDSETADEVTRMTEGGKRKAAEEVAAAVEDKPRRVVVVREEVPREFPAPETCVQFQQAWKMVRNDPSQVRSYLKKITPENLKRIFKHSLESDLFSELLSRLAAEEMSEDGDMVYSFLSHLSDVPRFGTLVMFMSACDRENLRKCLSRLSRSRTESEVSDLCRAYEVEI